VGKLQWGSYGDLLECVWLAVDRVGAHLDADSSDMLASLGKRVCDIWAQPDCGIWELEERRHNTFSKVGCWGWSDARKAYTAYAGSDELDASLLLLARTGFLDGADQRFTGTVAAIRGELSEGPLLYRLSGAREHEGAFVACSFWLVDALVRSGQAEDARKLWDELVARARASGPTKAQVAHALAASPRPLLASSVTPSR
jgi:hypothetical protein